MNGEQVVDANEMPLDNSTNAEYNEDDSLLYVPKKKDTRYINVNQSTLLAIKTALRDVYGGIDGIADEVAVSVNNTVYVVDSGREKGTITCRVVEKILIEDNDTREEFVRMVNHDALSKGSISDGLSKRFRSKYSGNRKSDRRQEIRPNISADNGKSSNNKKGISGNNGNSGGLTGGQFSYTPPTELSPREIISTMLDSVAESDRDKNLLAKYRSYLSNIEKNETEIARLKEERKNSRKSQKPVFTSKIEALEKSIANDFDRNTTPSFQCYLSRKSTNKDRQSQTLRRSFLYPIDQ